MGGAAGRPQLIDSNFKMVAVTYSFYVFQLPLALRLWLNLGSTGFVCLPWVVLAEY